MRLKNEHARMALLSLRVFLVSRRDAVNASRDMRAAAANAFDVLKPFLDTAENEIIAIYGTRPFPPQFFTALLKGFVNAERGRRIAGGMDVGPVTDTAKTLVPFLMMAEKLLDAFAAQCDDSKN
ncbi:MAG: hypothetical protein WC712_14995 [Candidatus Brocadiia bacterium]